MSVPVVKAAIKTMLYMIYLLGKEWKVNFLRYGPGF